MADNNCKPVNNQEVEDLFHWNTPEDRTEICTNRATEISNINRNPVKLVEYFTVLLRDFFSDPNNIQDDNVREIVIKKGILIDTMASIDTNTAGVLPKIVVEFCGKQAQQNFALNNQWGYNLNNSSAGYYSHWQIGIAVHVIGNTLQETLLIAEEANNFLHCFQSKIREALGLKRCQITEMSKPQYLEESTTQKAYLCSISLTVVAPHVWHIVQQYPRLKRVTFNPNITNI